MEGRLQIQFTFPGDLDSVAVTIRAWTGRTRLVEDIASLPFSKRKAEHTS